MLPKPFDQLSDTDIKQAHYPKESTIFREGDSTRGIFYLISGRIELRRYSKAGDVVVIHTAQVGSTFAEASLFSNTYHCDAYVTADASITEISKSSLLRYFNEDSAFALEVAKQFASQIQAYRRKVELFSIRDATERVYCAMIEGLLASNIKSFAAEIGLSHEVVYRSLAQLVSQGRLVKMSRGQFSLP